MKEKIKWDGTSQDNILKKEVIRSTVKNIKWVNFLIYLFLDYSSSRRIMKPNWIIALDNNNLINENKFIIFWFTKQTKKT